MFTNHHMHMTTPNSLVFQLLRLQTIIMGLRESELWHTNDKRWAAAAETIIISFLSGGSCSSTEIHCKQPCSVTSVEVYQSAAKHWVCCTVEWRKMRRQGRFVGKERESDLSKSSITVFSPRSGDTSSFLDGCRRKPKCYTVGAAVYLLCQRSTRKRSQNVRKTNLPPNFFIHASFRGSCKIAFEESEHWVVATGSCLHKWTLTLVGPTLKAKHSFWAHSSLLMRCTAAEPCLGGRANRIHHLKMKNTLFSF